jgi:mannosyltransferase
MGVGIRAYRQTDRSMWFDEASSWRISQLPLPELLTAVAGVNHVPLHYILLKVWTAVFGDSMWAMRGLSVLLSGVAMVAVYLFASQAFSTGLQSRGKFSREAARWIGLCSAALVAVSLLQIHAAWEVRMYTLGTALAAISSWTLFRALHAPSPTWRPWAIHAFVTLLLAYTHNYALFSIAGQVIFLAGYFFMRHKGQSVGQLSRDRQLRRAIVSYAAVAIGFGLWLPVLLRQTHQVQQEWWAGPLGAWGLLHRCYEMFIDGSAGDLQSIIAGLLLLAALVALVWKGLAGQWYVLSLTVVPYAMGAIVSFVLGQNVFLIRYLVFAHLFLLIGIAALVGRIRDAPIRNAVAGLLIANALAITIDSWWRLDIPSKPGVRGAVEYIEENGHPNEPVIVCGPMLYFPASYYFTDRGRCRLLSDGAPLPHNRGGPITTRGDLCLVSEIDKLSTGRVWVIRGQTWGLQLRTPSNWRLVDEKQFQGLWQGTFEVDGYDILSRQTEPGGDVVNAL